MSKSFVLHSAFRPSGDQPEAIRRLEEGLRMGLRIRRYWGYRLR